MKSLSIREMRNELTNIGQLVKAEGEIVVTRHGKPVARVLPVENTREVPDHAALRARMPKLGTPSSRLLREDRDER